MTPPAHVAIRPVPSFLAINLQHHRHRPALISVGAGQAEFVAWWREKVRGPGKSNSRRSGGIALEQAEEATGITSQQVSKWAKRLKDVPAYRTRLYGASWKQAMGGQLQQAEKAVLWWLGDWLNYGEREYGETYTQALDASDYSLSTLQSAKYVSGRIESCRRLQAVSWGVHHEAASLPPDQQEEVLAAAATESLTVREVRERVTVCGAQKSPRRSTRTSKP